MAVTRSDFIFLVNSGNRQRDEEEINAFIDVINRDYITLFSPGIDESPVFEVPWSFMRAITSNASNSYKRTLKQAENFALLNVNDERYYDYHVARVLSEAQQRAGAGILSYISNLNKVLDFAKRNPDKMGRMVWNVVYYAGLTGVRGKNGTSTGGNLFR